MKIKRKKLETYGRVKNRSPMLKVLLSAAFFLIFIAVLTLARSFITPPSQQSSITGAAISNENNPAGRVTIPQELDSKVKSLASSPLIQDLPKKAVLYLKVGEIPYTIRKASITLGKPSEPDISLAIPLFYLAQLNSDLCQLIKTANQNGDLSVNPHISKTSLMWKYKSMLEYRNCL